MTRYPLANQTLVIGRFGALRRANFSSDSSTATDNPETVRNDHDKSEAPTDCNRRNFAHDTSPAAVLSVGFS